MLVSLLYGFAIGLAVGMIIASAMIGKLYKDEVAYYKKDSDNWFKSYMKMLGYYNEMTGMWIKEATKNIGK